MPNKPYNFSKETLKRNNDFGDANRAAALLRKILQPHTKEIWDKTFFTRLRNHTIKIINTGNPALKGQLQFVDGDIDLLTYFQFNNTKELKNLVYFETKVELENTENVIISVPKIEFGNFFSRPKYATSLLVRYVCSIIHFDLEKGGSTHIDDLEIFIDKPFDGWGVSSSVNITKLKSIVCSIQC